MSVHLLNSSGYGLFHFHKVVLAAGNKLPPPPVILGDNRSLAKRRGGGRSRGEDHSVASSTNLFMPSVVPRYKYEERDNYASLKAHSVNKSV